MQDTLRQLRDVVSLLQVGGGAAGGHGRLAGRSR